MGPSTACPKVENKEKVENKRLVPEWCYVDFTTLYIVLHHVFLNMDSDMDTSNAISLSVLQSTSL